MPNNDRDIIIESESLGEDEDMDIVDMDDDEDEEDIQFEQEAAEARPVDDSFQNFVNPIKTVPGAIPDPIQMRPSTSAPPPPVQHINLDGPSEGYQSLDEEKADLLFKLDRLRKKGLCKRDLDFFTDIREIRSEYIRIKNEIELESSLAFSRKMLMAVVSTMEFMNKRYDPFDLQLEGWSESVMENMDSYDGTLEKLYYKYKNRVSMPPEMELMLSLAGSAFMFHMTNSMFKSALPNMRSNPDLIKSMMSALSTASAAQQQQQAPQQPNRPAPPPASSQPTPSYSMKGPSMDLGPLVSMMGQMQPMPPPAQTRPPPQPQQQQQSRDILPPPAPIVRPPTPPHAPVVSPLPMPQQPLATLPATTKLTFEEDRLSDIISEDLQSVSSVSDVSSMRSQDSQVKNVAITTASPGTQGKKRRGKQPTPVNGKVLSI